MLTPPLVTMASFVAAASRSTRSSWASSSGTTPRASTTQPAAASSGASIVALLSRIWPGRSGEPSVTSSSPVDSTATRTAGCAATERALTLASTPSTAGSTTVPARSTVVAGCDIVAGAPHGRPRRSPWRRGARRLSPRRSLSSTIATASAPAGTGAPVMIRTASPRPRTPSYGGAPAAISPTTFSSTGTAARSAAWTAYPSTAELANGGTSSVATTSAASTRPSTFVRSCSTAGSGIAGLEHDALGVLQIDHGCTVPPRREAPIGRETGRMSALHASRPTATTCSGRRGTASTSSGSRCAGRTRRGRRAARSAASASSTCCACRRRGGCASSCCSATSTSPTCGWRPTGTTGGARSTAPTGPSSTAASTSSWRAHRSPSRCRSAACRWRSATAPRCPSPRSTSRRWPSTSRRAATSASATRRWRVTDGSGDSTEFDVDEHGVVIDQPGRFRRLD